MDFKIPRPTEAEPRARLYIPVKPGMLEALKVGQKATFRVTGEIVELSLTDYEGKPRYQVCLEVSRVRSEEDNEFVRMAREEED